MRSCRVAVLLCCGLAGGLQAQTLPSAAPPEAGAVAAPVPPTPEPNVRHTVVEDDHVRVEELNVRGQVRRIVVRTQGSQPGSTYEIVPADGARDLSPGPLSQRGSAGRSLWTVLSF